MQMVLGSHVTNGFDQLAVNLIKLRAQLAAAVKYCTLRSGMAPLKCIFQTEFLSS